MDQVQQNATVAMNLDTLPENAQLLLHDHSQIFIVNAGLLIHICKFGYKIFLCDTRHILSIDLEMFCDLVLHLELCTWSSFFASVHYYSNKLMFCSKRLPIVTILRLCYFVNDGRGVGKFFP